MVVVLYVVAGTFVFMSLLALIKKPGSIYKNNPKEKNPMEGKKVVFVEDSSEPENADGVCGHLEAIGDTVHCSGFYESVLKRLIDIVLSFFGLLLLSPVFLVLSLWIVIDDPGPVLFTQKRIGKNKRYFVEHKRLTAYKSLYCKGLKVA